jgi:hypothetical protein
MASGFSPQNEAYIQNALSKGFFPSRDDLLNKAVDALRLRGEPKNDDELHAALQLGMDDIAAGRVVAWDPEDFHRRYLERLKKRQANPQQ